MLEPWKEAWSWSCWPTKWRANHPFWRGHLGSSYTWLYVWMNIKTGTLDLFWSFLLGHLSEVVTAIPTVEEFLSSCIFFFQSELPRRSTSSWSRSPFFCWLEEIGFWCLAFIFHPILTHVKTFTIYPKRTRWAREPKSKTARSTPFF